MLPRRNALHLCSFAGMKKSPRLSRIGFLAALALGAFLGAFSGGCGGAHFGSELAVRPTPRDLSKLGGRTLRLPQDEKFSIVLAPSQKAPGLGGTAEADARASGDGSAEARAKVGKAGSALGSFQIGHSLRNDGEQQMDLNIRIRGRSEYSLSNDPPGDKPEASAALKLYVRDGRNRLVRNIDLVSHTTEQGAASNVQQTDYRFTVTLPPLDTVTVFLAGKAEAATKDERSAEASLRLSGVEFEIEAVPAPAVKRTGDSAP